MQGIPIEGNITPLIDLFLIDRKSDLQKHCRTMVIRKRDLAHLVLAAGSRLLPWMHMRHHREYTPSHLHPSRDEQAALAAAEVGKKASPLAEKFMRKVSAIFDERRLVSGHMFVTPDQSNWHFFYFDQRDMQSHDNHWTYGPHIHFINYLWPNRTAEAVWNEFRAGNPSMRNALHIRFLDTSERRTF